MSSTTNAAQIAVSRRPGSDDGGPHLKRVLGRWDLVLLFVVAVFNLNVVPSIAANGGDGPPLGRSSDVIAGHPIEALVKTSVYLVLKNSLSAAS